MAFQFAPAWMENSDDHHAVIYRQFAHMVTSGASGVVSQSSLRVTERDGTADMSVDVAAGGAFVPSTRSVHQGSYPVYNDAVINVPITASHPTNDRIDRILVQVRDSAQDIALTQDDNRIYVIEGTPASVPELPPVDVDDWIELARVLVPAGASAVTNADITDVRQVVALSQVSQLISPTGGPLVPILLDSHIAASTETSYTFTDIPSWCRSLTLEHNLRSAGQGSGTGVTLRVNGDSDASNHERAFIEGSGAENASVGSVWFIGRGDFSGPGVWSWGTSKIHGGFASNNPDRWTVSTEGGIRTGSGVTAVRAVGMYVGPPGELSSLQVSMTGGSGWIAGSSFRLFANP